MFLNRNNFVAAANNTDQIAYSDEELLNQIQVLQCLCVYFLARKERLIHFALQLELNTLEGFASARKWHCDGEYNWRIRRKDGTLV